MRLLLSPRGPDRTERLVAVTLIPRGRLEAESLKVFVGLSRLHHLLDGFGIIATRVVNASFSGGDVVRQVDRQKVRLLLVARAAISPFVRSRMMLPSY